MKDIEVIIVPIDFLQHTDKLVELAILFGEMFKAHLKFLHVVELPNNWGYSEYPSLALYPETIDLHVRNKMKYFIEIQKRKYALCEGKVILGDISESIVDYAVSEGADLIIMGTHGKKSLTDLWLGSVAERVVKLSPCPTLTCNPFLQS